MRRAAQGQGNVYPCLVMAGPGCLPSGACLARVVKLSLKNNLSHTVSKENTTVWVNQTTLLNLQKLCYYY